MELGLIAIALGDIVWFALAFALGMASRSIGLPPLVGFLLAGFFMNFSGFESSVALQKLSDLGITLLLFTVGLKLNLRTLAKPQVWAVTGIHTAIVLVVFSSAIYALALAGYYFLDDIDIRSALLIAFALSFSSTVFVVKLLEEQGDMSSIHGRIAIGILIMQDIAAVVFLAASTGKIPTIWALGVVLLLPLRPVLLHILKRVGHGELLVLYGFILATGGAALFELVGLKGDLGALVLGVMIASHSKSDEVAKTMLSFKDLFLLGFFLSIGLSGQITIDLVYWAALLTPLILFKGLLFYMLLSRFSMSPRKSLMTSLSLTNFSEFGLIVISISVANMWIDSKWLIVIAIAMSMSFIVAAIMNRYTHQLYERYHRFWRRLQGSAAEKHLEKLDIGKAHIAIIGMGRVGTSAYNQMKDLYDDCVIGIDSDPISITDHQAKGRLVLLGDPSDVEFWERTDAMAQLDLVMLSLPNLATNLAVLEQLKELGFKGQVAATVKFSDQADFLKKAGADSVYNIYSEAGAGFASHVHQSEELRQLKPFKPPAS